MYMTERKSHPAVTNAIIMFVDAWRNETTVPDTYDYEPNLQVALAEQSKMGWDNFIMGRLSIQWKAVFVSMYKDYKTKQVTSANMIGQMYDILFQMWEARNKVLHDHTEIHAIHGEETVNSEIIK